MESFRGLLYVKHGRIGTESEDPDYYLQTSYGDYLLRFKERELFEPDYHLEYYCRRVVTIEAEEVGDMQLRVQTIKIIPVQLIPIDYDKWEVRLKSASQFEITKI